MSLCFRPLSAGLPAFSSSSALAPAFPTFLSISFVRIRKANKIAFLWLIIIAGHPTFKLVALVISFYRVNGTGFFVVATFCHL